MPKKQTPSRPPKQQANRAERRTQMLEEGQTQCVWCARAFDERMVIATTEHLIPRIKGGPSWAENEVVACRRCNSRRGHRTLTDWHDACKTEGWAPNTELIVGRLKMLQEAIAHHGGQRKARPVLRSQLRRLERILDQEQREGT
ncbi:MAG: HNH endonuclease [Myxococcota bacterium]|nr:HNH endonuclease [Myxococcota bacterium]